MRPAIEISHVSFTYPGSNGRPALPVLDDLTLSVDAGECVCVAGPSGCGKSTLLLIIGGLLEATKGNVTVETPTDASVKRFATVVFQDLRLFYWLTAFQNVALVLKDRGVNGRTLREKTMWHLSQVGLAEYADYYPHEHSGGMGQRLAIARAMATEAPVVLLDEPFSNLDRLTQAILEEQLIELATEQKKTVIIVTHDIGQAVRLADRVIVLSRRPGKIVAEERIAAPRPRRHSQPELIEKEEHLCKYLSAE
jgi:ABC-type nitrate/sulfonate/bicarbonate transport system ATPase subunit